MRLRLVADTVRGHRVAIVLWMVLGAGTQFAVASMLTQEFNSAPGGGAALAPAVEAAAAAMRVLRWPAERLDTLGGYLTYHNILLLPLLLGLYAAILGSQVIRGDESRGTLQEILATGWSRLAVVRDRSLGVLAIFALIAIGITAGTYAGLAAGGAADLAGSVISVGEAALCAFSFFALALLVSQFTRSTRSATGVSALVMTALYVFTNVWQKAGLLAGLRFLSPFFYFQQSRALVPGHAFDPMATLALVAISAVLLAAAAWAFERRDYASPLWSRRAGAEVLGPARVARPWLSSYWSAMLVRQGLGLLAWSVGAAGFALLVVSLEPEVRKLWGDVEYLRRFIAPAGGGSLTDQYLSFTGELLAPLAAAYAVTQVSAWITELKQGRVELLLTTPVSWTRLLAERLAGLSVGVLIITASVVLGLVVGAIGAGVPLRADGIARLVATTLLFGLAIGAVGALLAAWIRSELAAALAAVFLTVSYLADLLAPAYQWPAWISRLSIFDAFGRPYLQMPETAGLGLLLGLAVVGFGAAAWLSERSPKVA